MFQRTFLTGLAVTLLVVQACGSDGKKRTMDAGDAGGGGEAAIEPGSGGTSAGEPSSTAGEPNVPTAGTGGSEAAGGAGGQGPRPEPELLFVVRADAWGLADSAVESATYKQSNIYTTGSAAQDDVEGTNQIKVVGSDLGLEEGDAIIAFAELQPEPQNPLYLFSVTEGAEGGYAAATVDTQHLLGEPTGGDVFFSDGVESFRYTGEGGDEYGYNGLSFSELSLGLSRGVDETPPDELYDLQARDAEQPLTELYFTVNEDSVGLDDSAVDATPAEERGCTVFKSALDGSNTVAFSCADLGLAPGDQIDALTIYGTAAPERVVFSVSNTSQGAPDTAVATEVLDWGVAGSALFSSAGEGDNQLFTLPRALGLPPFSSDELDGLSVLDMPIGSVTGGASCMTTFDPFAAADGNLVSHVGTIGIGADVTVLVGATNGDVITSLIAFDTNTCAFLQQKDLPELQEDASGTAIVPLPGWVKTTPLDNVEYFQTRSDGGDFVLHRFDDSGAPINSYVVSSLTQNDGVEALTYQPSTKQLYLVTEYLSFYWHLRLHVLPIPGENVTTLDQEPVWLSLPCTFDPRYFGADPAGNLLLAQLQGDGASLRVCSYSASGLLQPAPYFWTPGVTPEQSGFIGNGAVHVSVTTDDGVAPLRIERGTYALP